MSPVPAQSEPALTTRTIGETESALNGLLFKVLGDTGRFFAHDALQRVGNFAGVRAAGDVLVDG